jgi:hypothetical protein
VRNNEKRSAILLLFVLGLPAVISAGLVVHELEHAEEAGHGHLEAVLHGHDHGFEVDEHQHPLVKSIPPALNPAKLVAIFAHAAAFESPDPATAVQDSISRPPQSPRTSDLCIWLL